MTITNTITCPNGLTATVHKVTRINTNLKNLFAAVLVESYANSTDMANNAPLYLWEFDITPQYNNDGSIVTGTWPWATSGSINLQGDFATWLKAQTNWTNLTTA